MSNKNSIGYINNTMIRNLFKLICGCIITFSMMNYSIAAPKIIGKVVAIVNNNVILDSDVDNMLDSIKVGTNPDNLPDDEILRHQVIERLIVENLILQQAAKANITVTDDEVTETIRNIAKENGMTIDELRGYLTNMGVNYSLYRERMHNDMLVDRARMSEVGQRIMISDKEVNDLASTIAKQPTNNIDINISHILIEIAENATKQQIEQKGELAKNIVLRLQNGESFAKLAATYSNDEHALQGGNMGWHKLNELPSIFEERLVRAQKNDVIGPLRSGIGYHILKVDDTKSEKPRTITAKEYNARHILIKTNVLITDDIAQEKLNDILQSIKTGTMTFEDAAKTYSEDPGSADNGGNLGWSIADRYDESFKNGLINLKKDEISKPIKSAFGWHLIQLMGSRSIDKTNNIQKDQAYRLIFNRKFTEELQVWIQELKGDAYIQILGDNNE